MDLRDLINHTRQVCPNASVGQDNDGQIVIYTDMSVNDSDELVPIPDKTRQEQEDLLTEHWVEVRATQTEICNDIQQATNHGVDASLDNLLEPLSDTEVNQLYNWLFCK